MRRGADDADFGRGMGVKGSDGRRRGLSGWGWGGGCWCLQLKGCWGGWKLGAGYGRRSGQCWRDVVRMGWSMQRVGEHRFWVTRGGFFPGEPDAAWMQMVEIGDGGADRGCWRGICMRGWGCFRGCWQREFAGGGGGGGFSGRERRQPADLQSLAKLGQSAYGRSAGDGAWGSCERSFAVQRERPGAGGDGSAAGGGLGWRFVPTAGAGRGGGEWCMFRAIRTTLARDLRVLVDSGYDLAELHLVDLFPQTFHLETVAVLRR